MTPLDHPKPQRPRTQVVFDPPPRTSMSPMKARHLASRHIGLPLAVLASAVTLTMGTGCVVVSDIGQEV